MRHDLARHPSWNVTIADRYLRRPDLTFLELIVLPERFRTYRAQRRTTGSRTTNASA